MPFLRKEALANFQVSSFEMEKFTLFATYPPPSHQGGWLIILDYSSKKSFNYKYPPILNAVKQTKDLIVVDSAFNLIGAFFHANCGGQTAETNQVWNKKIPYLTSFKDTFCLKTRQSTWTYKIPKFKWENYFKKHFHSS